MRLFFLSWRLWIDSVSLSTFVFSDKLLFKIQARFLMLLCCITLCLWSTYFYPQQNRCRILCVDNIHSYPQYQITFLFHVDIFTHRHLPTDLFRQCGVAYLARRFTFSTSMYSTPCIRSFSILDTRTYRACINTYSGIHRFPPMLPGSFETIGLWTSG